MEKFKFNYDAKALYDALPPKEMRQYLQEKVVRLIAEDKLDEIDGISFAYSIMDWVFSEFPEKKLKHRVYHFNNKYIYLKGRVVNSGMDAYFEQITDLDNIHIGVVLPHDISTDNMFVLIGMNEHVIGTENLFRRVNIVMTFGFKKLL